MNGDEEVIDDVDFEEALTERATARITGKVRAYLHLVSMVDQVASKTDHTAGELIDLFEKGENEKLNSLYQKAQNDDSESLAKAA